jgi:thiol-disulfide isomerase/thioredoxin
MAIDWSNLKKELDQLDEEIRKRPNPNQQLNAEIYGLKNIIFAHCSGILPTLEEIAKTFNSDNEFVKFYKELREEELKLEHLTKEEKDIVVKFAYPIRLYEESERTENPKKIITFEKGARLGIDTILGNGFVPTLIMENRGECKSIYRPSADLIINFLYKELKPEVSEINFLRQMVKNLNYWDNQKIEANDRIVKRFEDNYIKLEFLNRKN